MKMSNGDQLLETDELFAWIAEMFEEMPEDINMEKTRDEIPAWDSLGVLVLMANLDEKFNIVLQADEISKIDSVGAIVELVREKANKA
jgi:acyl carrier protein